MLIADPRPHPQALVRVGAWRVQVLTARLLRIEHDSEQRFEDRASFAAHHRRLPPPPFRVATRGGWTRIRTDAIALDLRDGPADAAHCRAVITTPDGKRVRWQAGQAATGNLGGTARTLDQVDGRHPDLGLGLLSTEGWALHDDRAPLRDGANGRGWVAPRRAGTCDWYLLGHGRDHRAALADAARVFGDQPIPPRFVLGYWWSRYWAYTDRELDRLVQEHRDARIPLDVLVLDMDWHREGWTGYTPDARYFPDFADFLADVHRRGLRVTLNLHPADGVARSEQQHAAMCRALQRNPRRTGTIPFDCTDPRFMRAYFDVLHRPLEDLGVDFWWLDWQQGTDTAVAGVDPLAWLNIQHYEDPIARGRRPLNFTRYHGLGSGRYPVGFSGDTRSTWGSLAAQPHFTATAANVLYGWWSHDIGGHLPGDIAPDLYVRWLQFGAFSPVLRTHTCKNAIAERRLYAYPFPERELMAAAVRRRYELVPAITSWLDASRGQGRSLCRPMYHEHGRLADAYACGDQYWFTDAFIVSPIVRPIAAGADAIAQRTWLPPGDWWDCARGVRVKAGTRGAWIAGDYLLDETPHFARAGTLVPVLPVPVDSLRDGPLPALGVEIWPGADGDAVLIDDDGAGGAAPVARIPLHWNDRTGTLTISASTRRPPRPFHLRLHAALPPRRVSVDGRALPWRLRPDGGDCWTWDGERACVVVHRARWNPARACRITLGRRVAGDGLLALFTRLALLRRLYGLAEVHRGFLPDEREVIRLVQAGNQAARAPRQAATIIADLRRACRGPLQKLLGRIQAARIERLAREQGEWRPAHERRVAVMARAVAVGEMLRALAR